MKILSSLTNRIFLASAALAVLSIAAAVYFVSRTTTRQAEAELRRGLLEAGVLVDQQCATLVQTLTVMARLVADAPPLKATVDIGDTPTAQPLAREYRQQLNAALLVLTRRNGAVLAEAGDFDLACRFIKLKAHVSPLDELVQPDRGALQEPAGGNARAPVRRHQRPP